MSCITEFSVLWIGKAGAYVIFAGDPLGYLAALFYIDFWTAEHVFLRYDLHEYFLALEKDPHAVYGCSDPVSDY
ncbi:MAG TPA: hypothetical protein DCZ61_02470 [Lachnospiraceae bacterium]|nr:hypothetical protein [Lachnospiraceae bacterium]